MKTSNRFRLKAEIFCKNKTAGGLQPEAFALSLSVVSFLSDLKEAGFCQEMDFESGNKNKSNFFPPYIQTVRPSLL